MAAYIVETFVTLLAVIAVAVAVLYGARRLGLGRPHGPLQLVGRLPLDARRSVYLVRVANQVLVLGVSEAGVTRLGEVEASAIPSTPAKPELRFSEVLARLKAKPSETDRPENHEEKSDA